MRAAKTIAIAVSLILGAIAVGFAWMLRNMRENGILVTTPPQEQHAPEGFEVKCFGGPCDGHVHEVPWDARQPYYVTRYLPLEDGEPDPSRIIGEFNGTPMFQPALAYYTQIDAADYVYVRDISEDEVVALMQYGIIPAVEDE